MNVAFTPGPWTVGPWIDSMGGHVYRVVTGAGRKVAGVTVYGKRRDGSTAGRALKGGGHTKTVASEECEANARLIAAAPELYEALEICLAMAPKPLKAAMNLKGQSPYDIGIAAIRKARGAA